MKLSSISEEFYPLVNADDKIITICDTELNNVQLVSISKNHIQIYNNNIIEYDVKETTKLVILALEQCRATDVNITFVGGDIPDNIEESISYLISEHVLKTNDWVVFNVNRSALNRYDSSKERLSSQLVTNFRAHSSISNQYRKGKDYNEFNPGSDPTMLNRAIAIHKTMHGRRWPELETAFLFRANTFRGVKADFIKPRLTLLKYLNQLKEPWVAGEEMATTMFKNVSNSDNPYNTRYLNYKSSAVIEFLQNRPRLMNMFLGSIIQNTFKNTSGYFVDSSPPSGVQYVFRYLRDHLAPYRNLITTQFIINNIPENIIEYLESHDLSLDDLLERQ